MVAVPRPVCRPCSGRATLRQDLDDNATLYGTKLENRGIVTSGRRAPKSAAALLALLNKQSQKRALSGREQNSNGHNENHRNTFDGMWTLAAETPQAPNPVHQSTENAARMAAGAMPIYRVTVTERAAKAIN